jgi:small subunit ribosomal protein S20
VIIGATLLIALQTLGLCVIVKAVSVSKDSSRGHAWPAFQRGRLFSRWPASRIFLMANTHSAKKAIRKIERRAEVNRSRRSQMRTYVRKVEEALAAGDLGAAAEALRAAQSLVMRAAQKGIVHAKAAARKVSRLSRRVNVLKT